MNNNLIFGKSNIQNIVSVEADEDKLVIFTEKDGVVSYQFLDNEYWFITNKRVSPKQIELAGDQHYKFYGSFPTWKDKEKLRYELKKKQIDHYHIYNPKEASMIRQGVTYFKGMKPSDVSVLFFDIETTGLVHNRQSKTLLISNTFRSSTGKITKKLFAYDNYIHDSAMFDDWCAWVREMDPSILCGHNIYGYDFQYMRYCADQAGTTLNLGRDGSEVNFNPYTSKFRKDGSQDIEFYDCHIYGREVVDTMFLSIKYDVKKKYESYGLKSIIATEGLEKKDRQFYDAGEIRNNYKNPEEWKKIKAYAMDDADDAMVLFDLMAPAFFYFTQSVSKPFQMMVNSATGSQINNIMVRSYLQENHSIAKANETEHYEGAISFGIPGIYSNCFKQDVSSLYPSIIRQYEIVNKRKDPELNFLKMVEHFTKERLTNKKLFEDTKNKNYEDLSETQKIAINSAYGFLGTPGLNYNFPEGAEKITRLGREILAKAIKYSTGQDVTYWQEKSV